MATDKPQTPIPKDPPPQSQAPKVDKPQTAVPKLDWLPKDAVDKIPPEWGEGKPNKKGEGWRWDDPKNEKGTGVRIDKGNPDSKFQTQKDDHVVVRKDGQTIGRDGNPLPGDKSVSKNHGLSHIPLKEWLKWLTPFRRK